MRQVMVRYKVKPDQVHANEELVRAVYDELERTQPAGLQYATFKLEDGVSFVHLAIHDEPNPLPGLPAFKEFQKDIRARCEEPPVAVDFLEVGSFRYWEG
jgi:hypothetical protein